MHDRLSTSDISSIDCVDTKVMRYATAIILSLLNIDPGVSLGMDACIIVPSGDNFLKQFLHVRPLNCRAPELIFLLVAPHDLHAV